MVTGGNVLGLVTLFLNSNLINDLTQYQVKYATPSYYYLLNASVEETELVAYDTIFDTNYTLFPKCCPPGTVYETDNRDCVSSRTAIPIYQQLNISVNVIKYGLYGCPVVFDRIVERNSVRRTNGDGTLSMEDETFEIGKFCIDTILEDTEKYVIRLCRETDYCLNDTGNGTRGRCIYKCCGDTYSLRNNACGQNTKMGLRVKSNTDHFGKFDSDYGFLYGAALTCSVANWIDFRQLNFSVERNGSLFRSDESREYKVNEYCLDTRYNSQTDTSIDQLIVCEFRKDLYAQWAFLRICVILSCVCFLLTIVVYIFSYKLKKLVEKLIACFCFVDLVFYILYALRIFYVPFEGYCTAFGYVYYFLLISRLSWLNVLSYQIWQTVGRVRAKVDEPKQTLRKKFLQYAIYGISVPLVCTILFILADQRVYVLSEALKPYINPAGCGVDTSKIGNYSHYLYLFLPIWILIIINIACYVKTVWHFIKVKSDLKKIGNSNSNQKHKEMKTNNKNGMIILKLGLIMGITWIYYIYNYIISFENIAFLQTIGTILMFSNVLEGVYFFIIFVIKWKVIKEVLYNFGILKKKQCLSPTMSTTSTICSTVSNESINDISMTSVPK